METNDPEVRLQSIRSRQQEAVRKHAAAQARLDGVRAQQKEITDRLIALGYETPQQAAEEARSIKEQTESLLTEIEAKVKAL